MQLKYVDVDICRYLDENSRASNREIAKALGISQRTVKNRLEVLHEKGLISHVTLLDVEKTGNLFLAIIGVHVHKIGEELLDEISALPNIVFTSLVTGQFGLIAIALVNSREMLFKVISNDIESMPQVKGVHTFVVLKHKGMDIPISKLFDIEGMIESITSTD